MNSVIDPATPPLSEIEWTAVRSQGPGGQNVNKTATAMQLRFDIAASSLAEPIKAALLLRRDRRITADGVLVIKAQRFRTQERNREDALVRLASLIDAAAQPAVPRKPTRPSRTERARRVDSKVRRGKLKALRGNVED
jgi:ribosome-associated protein